MPPHDVAVMEIEYGDEASEAATHAARAFE
jgi:hypothetical protein